MNRNWPQEGGSHTIAPNQRIGRAHLDEAQAAGEIAGRDADKTISDCPFSGSGNLMTAKAWEKGFRVARATAGERD